eukprot:4150201-Heterocapsa_arctica.AAC.1
MGYRLLPTIKVSVILTPNIDIRFKRPGRSASKSEIVGNCFDPWLQQCHSAAFRVVDWCCPQP